MPNVVALTFYPRLKKEKINFPLGQTPILYPTLKTGCLPRQPLPLVPCPRVKTAENRQSGLSAFCLSSKSTSFSCGEPPLTPAVQVRGLGQPSPPFFCTVQG